MNVIEEIHLSFYRVSLTDEVSTREKGVKDAQSMVEDSRQLAVQARRDRQVLEKLKDRHLQKHRREAEAREQKEMDELALYSHNGRIKPLQPSLV